MENTSISVAISTFLRSPQAGCLVECDKFLTQTGHTEVNYMPFIASFISNYTLFVIHISCCNCAMTSGSDDRLTVVIILI